MVQAAKQVQIPIVISFTIEIGEKFPTGQNLKEAIQIVDQATQHGPIYYMIDCRYPSC